MGSAPPWIGFARLPQKKVGKCDDSITKEASSSSLGGAAVVEYSDGASRKWQFLSQEFEDIGEWSGGLLTVNEGTGLVQKKKSKSSGVVQLDDDYANQSYTPELYDSACHVVGTGATWRVHSGGGYHRVRIHLVDWWHWPAKDGNVMRHFDVWLHTAVEHPGVEPEKHTVFCPNKGYTKVLEFLVHVEPAPGFLDIEVRTSEDAPEMVPCFSGFEVMKVPREDLVPRDRKNETNGVKTEFLKDALENPEKAQKNIEGFKKKDGWFPKLW